MIKKTLITFLILIVINILIRDVYKPDIVVCQAWWQERQVKAQDYLCIDSLMYDNVVVGSSMTELGINTGALSELNFGNLAFGGESPREGLDLIIKKGMYPKRLFIEMNTVLLRQKDEFLEIAYNPFLYYLRKPIPSFRDGKQPLPLMTAIFEARVTSKIIPNEFSFLRRTSQSIVVANHDQPEDLGRFVPELPVSSEEEKVMAKLRDYIKVFEKKGTIVVFYEMPTNTHDCSAEQEPKFRAVIKEMFSPDSYIYLPAPECDSYQTTDGIHLDSKEAARYTEYFKSQVDSLIRIGK